MHVAVIGAGALGLVYGVRLAVRTKCTVTFVVRPKRVDSTDPFVIESAWNDRRETLETPRRATKVPDDADVVLLTIGTEDLEALDGLLGESTAPIVVITPTMPQDWNRLVRAYGKRALSAMPTMSAYVREGTPASPQRVVRYWVMPAPNLIDEPRPPVPAVTELVESLTKAGLRTKLELGTHEINPATTVGFICVGMGLAIAGSIDALSKDEALLELVARACTEGQRLGARLGTPLFVASIFPVATSRWAIPMLRLLPEEARFFAEDHFGRKIADQHRVMIRQMIELAEEKGLPHSAFDDIERRLAVSSSNGTP
jgi:ketopantoate reductase